MKTYKVVRGPMAFEVDKGKTENAFKSFEVIINQEAINGWNYHSMETLTVQENQGCLSQPIIKNYYMLIFEKDE